MNYFLWQNQKDFNIKFLVAYSYEKDKAYDFLEEAYCGDIQQYCSKDSKVK